jgi:hypothetical protein
MKQNKEPTVRQKRLAEVIMENPLLPKPLTKGQMLVKAGYSPLSAEGSSASLMKQEGLIQALADRGFNEETAKSVVVDILTNEEEKSETRLNAAREVFRVFGSYAPEKSTSMHLNVDTTMEDTDMQAIRLEFEEKIRNKIIGNENV